MYFLYGTFLYYWVKKNKFNQRLSLIISNLALIVIFFSFIQYFLYPDLRNLYYLGWDEHLYRMFGLFFDTSIAATIYSLFFIYFLNQEKMDKKIKIIVLFLFLTAIVLSFSRATYLVLFLTLLIYLILKKKVKFILFFLTVFFLVLLLAPKPFGEGVNLKRQFSIISRVNDYRLALKIWKNQPIFGIGYNRIGFYKDRSQRLFPSHSSFSFSSSYLIILVTGGIVGLFLFLLALFKLFLIKETGRIYLFFVYVLSLFDNIILHPFIMFLLILFLINDS
jgi:O-antigen ligase